MFDAGIARGGKAMNELDAIFKAINNVTLESLLKFGLLIVPGFIAYRTAERIGGRDRTKVSEHIIDLVICSMLCDIVMLGAITLVSRLGDDAVRIVVMVVSAIMFGGALPVLLAIGWNRFSDRLVRRGTIPDMTAKPWDHVFRRIAAEKKNLGVIVTLRDGRRVGARLADPGYTSSFPAAEQLMLGQTWRVNEAGEFIAPIDGSWGLLVDKADCETTEFLEWDVIDRYLTHHDNGKVNHDRQERHPERRPIDAEARANGQCREGAIDAGAGAIS